MTLANASQVTVHLLGHCPTAVNGQPTDVVYAVESVSASRYRLRREGVTIADRLTSDQVFAYTPPSYDTRALLNVDLRVNVNPNEGWKTWRLETDIALRNTLRE